MQVNVNAENVIQSLVQNFGEDNIQTCDGGIIKLQVKELQNGDILSISNLLQWSDVQVKRSDTRLLILFIPKPWVGEYSEEVLNALHQIKGESHADYEEKKPIITQNAPNQRPHPCVRDFYENLPQDARIAAFNNTAKSKWDRPARDLKQAILESFYINDSPEGANYWQDVILENEAIKI